jgi:hypothetical protein
MKLLPIQLPWLVLAAYPALGLALGLSDPWLGWVAQLMGAKPGVATAVSVNLLLPLAAVALGFVLAHVPSAWLGAAAMTLGFVAGLAVQYPAGVRDWSPAGVISSIPPVLFAAALGYAVLGTLAAYVAQTRGWPLSGGT